MVGQGRLLRRGDNYLSSEAVALWGQTVKGMARAKASVQTGTRYHVQAGMVRGSL